MLIVLLHLAVAAVVLPAVLAALVLTVAAAVLPASGMAVSDGAA